MTSVEQMQEAIVELTDEVWTTTKSVLLLSRLGLSLNKRDIDLANALGREKLSVFIQKNLGDRVQVVLHPTNPTIVGLVPKAAELDQNLSAYFKPSERVVVAGSRVAFHPKIWRAFTQPLADGMSRIVELSPLVQFNDMSPTEAEGKLTIERELIVPYEKEFSPTRTRTIYANIMTWVKKNNLTIDSVEQRPSNARAEFESSSLMHALLTALDPHERKRVNMPLDIVDKLLATKPR